MADDALVAGRAKPAAPASPRQTRNEEPRRPGVDEAVAGALRRLRKRGGDAPPPAYLEFHASPPVPSETCLFHGFLLCAS